MNKLTLNHFLSYPAFFTPDEGQYQVTVRTADGFKDLTTCSEYGTIENAKLWAFYIIRDAASFAVRDKHPIAPAGKAQPGDCIITIDPDLALKFLLRTAILEAGVAPAQIAKGLSISPQNLQKRLSFNSSTALKYLLPIFDYIGRPLKVSC